MRRRATNTPITAPGDPVVPVKAARPKRASSIALNEAQHAYLDEYAAQHPEWDQKSVPKDDPDWQSANFPSITPKTLEKRIVNHFGVTRLNLGMVPLC